MTLLLMIKTRSYGEEKHVCKKGDDKNFLEKQVSQLITISTFVMTYPAGDRTPAGWPLVCFIRFLALSSDVEVRRLRRLATLRWVKLLLRKNNIEITMKRARITEHVCIKFIFHYFFLVL